MTLTDPGDYTLTVNSDGVAGTETSPFVVTAAPASRLAVTAQPPENVTAGAGFPITVTAEDSYGNVDTSFNGPITIALASNPGGATLGGTLTATAVNGVATFSNLTISSAGNGYTLQATSTGLTSATTNAMM